MTITAHGREIAAGSSRRGNAGATRCRFLAWLLAAAASLPGATAHGQTASFVGASPQVVATNGNVAPTIPAGAAAGDLAVLIVVGRPNNSNTPTTPAGWTLRSSAYLTSPSVRILTFYRVLTGGDANPVVDLPGGWNGNSAGMSAQLAVWRGVDTATPFDVADATSTSGAAASWVPPALTTATAGAWVVSAVASSDTNNVDLGTAAGFTARMSGASYATTTGADHSVGLADKLQTTAGTPSMPTWQQNANSPDGWAGITFALRPAVPPEMRLSMSFEETAWTGTAGEVKDDSSYGLNGVSVGGATTANPTPAIATNPGTCRYGTFSGSGQYVEIANNPALNITTQLTVTAWIYLRGTPSELQTIVSKDTNYEFHIDNGRHVYWWWNDSSGNTRSITTTNTISLNAWHHVAITYQSGAQRIYIDGVVQSTTGSYTGTLAQNTLPLYVGEDWNFLSRVFNGYIEEVRVIARTLSASEVVTLRDETHACANTAKFTINHGGFGINCVPQTVTVGVVDSVTGTPLLNYNAQVQLDTQNGYGTWALVSGSGTFSDATPNDGVATYNWPLGQSSATFTLYYPQGPSPINDIDVLQVSNTGIRDTDAEGPLVFSPNGFTVTAAALSNPPPGAITTFATSQTAGTDFSLYLAAYGQTPTDPTCGIIETYTGTKSLKFWSTYVNPATGTRNATINAVSAATSEAASAAQSVTFTNGQAIVTAKYKDVGRINIQMKDDTTTNAQLPNGIRGATAGFVVKPYDFVLSGIQNATGTVTNPQAASAAGAVFIAAGAPFRATVTVRDAEGSTTPNYGRESPAEGVRLVPTLFLPAGGANPLVGGTGFGAFTNGVATGTDFAWSEVGIIQVRGGIGDLDYLGAGDVAGATLSERIGRFIPSRFVVALNSPLLTTGCTAGGFTYQGQPFGYSAAPVLTATAVSVSGSTTTNYTGSFFKLTNATLSGRSYTSAAGALDTSGLPATTVDPAIASPSGGVATLTFGTGAGLSFTKTLLAPYQAGIQLAINVQDGDGVAAVGAAPLGNPVTFGVPTGIPFTAGQEIRYGRIRVGTAVGSELVNLPVPMRAEYYASAAAGFVANTADTCTTGVTIGLSNFTESLSPGQTCVRDSGLPGVSGAGCAAPAPVAERFRVPPTVAAGGDFNLRLQAPGAGHQGSAVVTATVPTWLRFDWNTATPGDENPAGQATFGIYGGQSRQIYTREIY
jgi:MSHA biogenesis protein MshQ